MRVTLAALASVIAALFELTIFDHFDRRGATASRPGARHRLGRRHRPRRRPRLGVRRGTAPGYAGTAAARVVGVRAPPRRRRGACLLVAWLGRIKLVAPVIAVFLFSFVYSIVLLVHPRRPLGPAPIIGPDRLRPAGRRLRHGPRRDPRGRSLWRSSIAASRRRADRLVSDVPPATSTAATTPSGARSAFLMFALAVILAFGRLGARLFYLQVVERRPVRGPGAEQPHGRPGDPVDPRPDLRPHRAGRSSRTCRPSRSRSGRPTCPLSRRDEVVAAARGAARASIPPDINEAIDGNPGSRFDLVRIASGRARDARPGLIAEAR